MYSIVVVFLTLASRWRNRTPTHRQGDACAPLKSDETQRGLPPSSVAYATTLANCDGLGEAEFIRTKGLTYTNRRHD